MITIRAGSDRGHARHGWLDSHHTFSFGHYYDPQHMGVSTLRVINDDRVVPGAGFDTHPHRDMEIVSYILEGQIEHRDTLGSHGRLRAGEVQVMSAGTGIMHSEFNPSPSEPLHFLQIWIRPARNGLQPSYAQRDFSANRGLTLIVSGDGRDGSLRVHQDAEIYQLRLDASTAERVELATEPGRIYYLQVASGALELNGQRLEAGDGAQIQGEQLLQLQGTQVEALLFNLAA